MPLQYLGTEPGKPRCVDFPRSVSSDCHASSQSHLFVTGLGLREWQRVGLAQSVCLWHFHQTQLKHMQMNTHICSVSGVNPKNYVFSFSFEGSPSPAPTLSLWWAHFTCVKSRERCHQRERNRWGRKRWKHSLTVHFCFAAAWRAADLNCVTSLTKLINSPFKKTKQKTSSSFNQCQQPITIFHHPV